RATWPMRVMMRMLATTYGLSVTSTPTLAYGDAAGPMRYGTTYIVLPCMLLLNSGQMRSWASWGLIQLLVGPASSACWEQIKVRCSVRATSCGLERWRKQFGSF